MNNSDEIKKNLNLIISSDKSYFEKIFRDDIVIIFNKHLNDQINQIFGIKKSFLQKMPFIGKIQSFKKNNKKWKNCIKNGELKENYSFYIFKEIKSRISHKFNIFKKINSRINQTFNYFKKYFISNYDDEIFIFKENNKFKIIEFKNENQKKIFCENSTKYFFFLNSNGSSTYFYPKKRIINQNIFKYFFYQKKFEIYSKILNSIHKKVLETQKNNFKKIQFYFLNKFFIRNLKKQNIKVSINFHKFSISSLNIELNPISYDGQTLMMTFLFFNSDNFVTKLFKNIQNIFLLNLKILINKDSKINWTTKYIDDLIELFYKNKILKKKINLQNFPEFIPLLFPKRFFYNLNPNVSQNFSFVRSVIDFKKIKKFEFYDEYFDDEKMERIRRVSEKFMMTVFF